MVLRLRELVFFLVFHHLTPSLGVGTKIHNVTSSSEVPLAQDFAYWSKTAMSATLATWKITFKQDEPTPALGLSKVPSPHVLWIFTWLAQSRGILRSNGPMCELGFGSVFQSTPISSSLCHPLWASRFCPHAQEFCPYVHLVLRLSQMLFSLSLTSHHSGFPSCF